MNPQIENAAYLIALCFAARTAAHLAHLKTTSYARHKALGEYYEGLVDKVDAFAESFQGTHGIIAQYPLAPELNDDDPLAMVQGVAQWLRQNRDQVCNSQPDLENLVDDLLELHSTTRYKLKNLS